MNSKWIAALLIASLALNLLFVGFTVGRSHHQPEMDPGIAFPSWARTLPKPRRKELRL